MGGIGEALLVAGIAAAASTGAALATRPSTPRVTPPLPPPPPPPKAEAPPAAPTETAVSAEAGARKQRDAMRFGLAQTILTRRAPVGTTGGYAGTPTLGV